MHNVVKSRRNSGIAILPTSASENAKSEMDEAVVEIAEGNMTTAAALVEIQDHRLQDAGARYEMVTVLRQEERLIPISPQLVPDVG